MLTSDSTGDFSGQGKIVMPNTQRFLEVRLSDIPTDVEVVACNDSNANAIITAVENKGGNASLISPDKAKLLISNDFYYGVGCYVEDSINVVVDEYRRDKAYDLQLYLAARIGVSAIQQIIKL